MTSVIVAPWPDTATRQIQAFLQNGRTLAFPTETFYGLGGNAFSEILVEQIFQIKQRPREKPLLVLAPPAWLSQLSTAPSLKVAKLMKHFWPGPLTLILPAHPNLPEFLLGPYHTIAIRHSSSPIVQSLISIGQCPLIGTSANFSEAQENTQPAEVLSQLGNQLDLLIDGGPTIGGQASTIVDTMSSPFQILRQGAISSKILNPFL